MRRPLLAVAVAALAFCGGARAAAPNAAARAFYVVNASNGDVLAARHADDRVPIASITKLMTVLVALDHLRPDDVVTVSGAAAQVGESRIPLTTGQRVTVRDLLAGALIQSANNAADALASAAANGSVPTFVRWMNERARELGLRDTHFVRPDGLDAPGHYSSARDVAVLARVAMHRKLVRDLVRLRSDTIEGGAFVVHTWNDLLGVVPGLVGVKTGHTGEAGWCEVAAVRRGGFTIYAVILGSPTRSQRNDDLQRLLAWGVSQYRTLKLVATQPYAWAALPYGRPRVALVARQPLTRVVRVGRPVVTRIVAPPSVALPVRKGERLGRVEVWAGRRLLGSRPLLAARAVPRPGVLGRIRWYGTRTVHHLFGLFS
ncbi:MAG TPA: D-alanyl-D-alanine carboxypeptidase family protein [Gaiellaceae bacterium]|nr:D-alanyl-D-alanine carboxypeptidase family protein [Gaiellaceae bacterium]